MIKRRFRFLTACLLLIILTANISPIRVNAQETVTLRVAFYPLEGFFEYGKNGKETGYGVDLLSKITKYSGICFEYIPADTWEGTKQMLLDGEADIRMPATAPQTPSTTLGYSENRIATTGHVLMTLKSNEDMYYEDYELMNTWKIGMTESMYNNLLFEQYEQEFDFRHENIIFYDTYDEVRAGLDCGEVDAVVSNIMDMDGDMKQLLRFDSVPNYITMTIDNPYLAELDNVLGQIRDNEPNYLAELDRKWFPERNGIPLTREETEYINSLGELTFAIRDGQGYLSMLQDGTYTGIFLEVAELICSKLGVNCIMISEQEASVRGNDLILYPETYFDYEWADQTGIDLTLPYFTEQYYEVSKRNIKVDEASCRVAVVRNHRFVQDILESGYSQNQMVWCRDYAACIQAIEDGDADITFVSSYAAEYYLSMYRYANLSYNLTDFTHEVVFGIQGDQDGRLFTIVYKMLDTITQTELQQLVSRSTSNQPHQDIMQEWVISEPYYAFAIASVFGAVVVAIILMAFFVKKTRQQNIKLQRATAAKSDFLSRMSHDIRTPLNVIIGMNRLARENQNPPDTEECLDKIEISSEFLLGLINDVLDMERVETGEAGGSSDPLFGTGFQEIY